MADERWVLVILICLIVVLTLIDISAFTATKIQSNRIRNLTTQIQQQKVQLQEQQIGINTFVSQLQQCKTIKDLDNILKTINVERVK